MRVLLISANTATDPFPVYPLGLDYVAGAIAADHEVRILDLNQVPEAGALEAEITEFNPQMVGISLRNIDNTDALHPVAFIDSYGPLMQRVRRVCKAPIVLGGSGFTIFPEAAMQILEADYGIVGEGERLGLLLAALAHGEDPARIPGVITPGDEVSIPPPWTQPLNRHFDPRQPHVAYYLENGGMLNLQTKRGCPFRCIYCTYPYIEGRTMRLLEPASIARTARQLQAGGARYFFVTDSAFNAHTDHSLAVARAFKKAGLSIPWGAFFAPTRLPEDYFKVLADCGLRHVEFGTESLCDPVLTTYGKPFDVRQVFQAHKAAVAAGLHVAHYFLLGGPGENGQTLTETLCNIDKLERSVLFIFCGMRIYPQTALYKLALAQGQIRPDQDLTHPVYYHSPSIDSRVVIRQVNEHARGRVNWVMGAGGPEEAKAIAKMYKRGRFGPLWEYLIR